MASGGPSWLLGTPGGSLMAAGHKKASISKIESNIAGESIPLMFGVLPRDNSPNIGLPIWGSDLSMILWGGLWACGSLGVLCVFSSGVHFWHFRSGFVGKSRKGTAVAAVWRMVVLQSIVFTERNGPRKSDPQKSAVL